MNVNCDLKRLHPRRLVVYNEALIVVNQGSSRSPLIIINGGLPNLIRPVGTPAVLKGAHFLDTIQCCCLLGPRITCREIDELGFGIGAHALIEVFKVKGGTRRSVEGLAEVLHSLLRLVAV
jgi:hypothetical protein